MRLTDRIDKLQGVLKSFWQGSDCRLTVYYDERVSVDTIHLRVASELATNQLQYSIGDYRYISAPKGAF